MANKFLTAVVAGAMLAPSVKAQDRVNTQTQNLEDTTKLEIVDALSEENSSSEREIPLEDARLQLKIDDVLNGLSSKDRKRIKKITKYYGEEKFKVGLTNIVKEIENNPDNYGTFDSKGGYSLNKDAIERLSKSEYSEYFKDKTSDNWHLVAGTLASIVGVIFGVWGTWYGFMRGRFSFNENGDFVIDKSKKV